MAPDKPKWPTKVPTASVPGKVKGKKVDEVYLDGQKIGTVIDSLLVEAKAGFLSPPYSPDTHCLDQHSTVADDGVKTMYLCCKAKGHLGDHGHPDYADSWSDADAASYTPKSATVEVVIPPGKSTPDAVRINGWTVPLVKNVTVEYEAGSPRVVILEIYATELVEVSE